MYQQRLLCFLYRDGKSLPQTENFLDPPMNHNMSDQSTMGDQDNNGHHELPTSGVANPDESIDHPEPSENITEAARKAPVHYRGDDLNAVAIPCHHIRLGDFLMLEDRPCQVIRFSTSAATGQYRYLGVDVFTKRLYEGVSFISNPAPSVVVQTMLGPTFKQCRVIDINDGQIVAMTNTGEVKQNLPVIQQPDLYSRVLEAFSLGRGSVSLFVLIENGSSRENRRAIVEQLLRSGADVNALDNNGRTPMFNALEDHTGEMVKLLLDHKVNLDVLDNSGRTVLDVCVEESRHYLTAFTLLKHGAQPTKNLSHGVSKLLMAAAAGRNEEIERLLKAGVKHSSCDRLGYTALHEAACFGHYDTAKMLIQKGADVNRAIAHGGATVLHAVIQRGREHPEFLAKHRRVTPSLTEGHLRIVALLLQNNADTRRRRIHDKRTVQELVTEELKIVGNLGTIERCYLEKVLILLNRCDLQEAINEGSNWSRATGIDDYAIDLLKGTQLQAHYHCSGRNCPPFPIEVGNLVGDGERSIFKHAICQLSAIDDETSKVYRNGIHSFTTESYHEVRGTAPQARFRHPLFTTLSGSRGGIFSLVIPYFDSENLDCFVNKQGCDLDSCKTSFKKAEVAKKLYETSDSLSSFHAPLTLDQSYCLSLHDSRVRDKDQVVIKYIERQERLTRTTRQKRLLMVNQIWIWKVDADAPTNAGLSENVFHIFEQSIAYRAQEDADCYASFNKSQKDLTIEERSSKRNSKANRQRRMEIEAELCNITKELDHLCEIKDIKDELKMIHKVLEDQRAVINQYVSSQEEVNFVTEDKRSREDDEWLSGDGESELLLEAKNILEQRISKVKSLFTDASTVENLKQGSLIVVRDTRSLANEADQRAKYSAWQSKLPFIFTIVTVVFIPISFISSFMAVPTREFPHPNGDDIAWRWWQVFIATIIAPWVEWNRFVRPWTRHDSEREMSIRVEEPKQRLDV
ncbi:unnamed protein product [Fusarium graminearum]|nr:unnamed protein product [Fusarium graminearum]